LHLREVGAQVAHYLADRCCLHPRGEIAKVDKDNRHLELLALEARSASQDLVRDRFDRAATGRRGLAQRCDAVALHVAHRTRHFCIPAQDAAQTALAAVNRRPVCETTPVRRDVRSWAAVYIEAAVPFHHRHVASSLRPQEKSSGRLVDWLISMIQTPK